MGIGEQFAGLDMKSLIGGPLSAAAESSILLAQNTADFINKVGFDAQNKIRSVQFKYTSQAPDPDGNVSNNEMSVDVPLLAIVPIPNLQIDEVNILFDMEVKQSERSESATDMTAATEGTANLGFVKVSIKGSVSSHSSNTRSSDNSAKYHVDVRATNHGIPEGLARVLDMMAASVSPSLVSSRSTDASGNELMGKSKQRNQKLKQLREERSQLESADTAARDNWQVKLKALNDRAKSLRSTTTSECMRIQNANLTDDESDTTKKDAYEAAKNRSAENDIFWDDFSATIENTIDNMASAEGEKQTLVALYPTGEGDGKPNLASLEAFFTAAVDTYSKWKASTKVLDDNKVAYNNTMMDISSPEEAAKPA